MRKKKKLLFAAPNYYGFNEVVFKGIADHSGYDCINMVSNGGYIYQNYGEKILNFFSKLLLRTNLKKKWAKNQNMNLITKYDYFDISIINRPDVLHPLELDLLLSKTGNSILLLWDSLDKIDLRAYIQYFDEVYSFDSKDCTTYGLEKITNFYYVESASAFKVSHDIAYLGTNDDRLKLIIKLIENFNRNAIKCKAKIFTYKSISLKYTAPDDVEVINEIIPFKDAYKFYLDSKCILDVAHENQIGLSFRAFEAMGLRKKTITTNKEIVNYDFFNPRNIFVIEDLDNIHIPREFIDSPYVEIPEPIYEKYSLKNWVRKILERHE